MTHLQALINLVRHAYQLRITIADHQTEIELCTHPNPSNGTQRVVAATNHPHAEIAALQIMDQLATTHLPPTPASTPCWTTNPSGAG